ncbi:MAG: PQQ-dependent sugar dehydrogenase [Luteimonas sp.]
MSSFTPRLRIALAVILPWLLVVAVAVAQPAPESVQVTAITSALSGPVGITHPGDGTQRLFVIQQGGAIRVVRNGALNTAAYLTVSTNTQCRETPTSALQATGFVNGGEQGLLGLAFHPDFARNGQFFVNYTGAAGDTVIARYTVSNPNTDVVSAADQASCLVVLRVDQEFANHNGGNLLFGPDRLLYIGLGDGGSANDPCNRAQTLDPATLNTADTCAPDLAFTDPDGNGATDRRTTTSALLGKILRIDVDRSTAAGAGANGLCGSDLNGSADYAIPPTNPFVGAGARACGEVYTYGMRNPWRFSFDRLTGDLIVGDVGQDRWEEINFLAANANGREAGNGVNFDWNACEGRHLRGSCTNLCPSPSTAEVIITYSTRNSCPGTLSGSSITGGYRYRGPDPLLQGVYFYGDAARSRVRMSVDTGNGWVQPTSNVEVPAASVPALAGVVVAFGEDQAGALYVVGGNTLYRLGIASAGLADADTED